MGRLAAIVLALFVASCADGDTLESAGETTPMTQPPAARESLTLASKQPVPASDELSARLGADAVEGGCAYLETNDGTRYEVVYPRGWRVRLSPLAVIDPNGEVFATAGDEITVRGDIADDMASICQIGPIFRATEVER